ncbi:MAG: hypothetical protein JWO10_1823 [Microbacteriaceae bacterium]|nr:hypothetical protein [Microbacteriaceae bacterium]
MRSRPRLLFEGHDIFAATPEIKDDSLEEKPLFEVSDLFAPLAKNGTPPYFHRNPPHIKFDFDQGSPSSEVFPVADLSRISDEILARDGKTALDYMDPNYGYADITIGWTPLREQIAGFVESRNPGVTQSPDGIIVTNGSVQALALAATAYLSTGDAVFVEGASFPFGLRYFQQTGATTFGIAMDHQGLLIDSLADAIAEAKSQGLRPKMIYTIASFQLPTGTVLPLERRKQLLDLANLHNMLVIEDAIYSPFRYSGEPVTSLYSLDTEGRVIQSDSFAKTVAPGTRIGWMAGSPEAILALAMVRQDLGPNQWVGRVMEQYVREGLMPAQIQRSIDNYTPKRDATAAALKKYCGDHVTFHTPDGGFYFWVELEDGIDWPLVQAHAYDRGIAMRPGEMFSGQTNGRGFVRLAFTSPSIAEIEDGMQAFGASIDATLAGERPSIEPTGYAKL